MSITSWERRALADIDESLSASAPELASMLAMFNRLTAGEGMPAHTRISGRLPGARPRRVRRYPSLIRHQQARQFRALERWSQVCLAVWVIFSAVMVAIAVVLSGLGPQACPASWPTGCNRLVQTHAHPGASVQPR